MKTSFFSLLALFCVTSAVAQKTHQDITPGSFSSSRGLSNEAFYSVLGSFGGTGKIGSDATVIQAGTGNTLNLNLVGSGNVVDTKQTGNDNTLTMDFSGTNSKYVLDQDGDVNTMSLSKVTSNGINFQVSQKNNNNVLTVDGSGTGALPALKIEQTGGMQVTIESNLFYVK
jgi:hypothetical protein